MNTQNENTPAPPTHYTDSACRVIRHPSQIEKERQDAAYYLRVVWPEICGEAEEIQPTESP